MSRLTKAQIVAQALDMVGSTGIQSRGEDWLDLILDDLARSYRWPQLQKEHQASVGDGTEYVAYPSDYGFLTPDVSVGHVGTFQQSGDSGKIHVFPAGMGITRGGTLHSTDAKGPPCEVSEDAENSRWLLHPISNVSGTLRLEYQRVPAPVATTATVWWPNDLALVQAVRDIAEQRRRGNQVPLTRQVSEAAKILALRSPVRAQLWIATAKGSGLDRRLFRG